MKQQWPASNSHWRSIRLLLSIARLPLLRAAPALSIILATEAEGKPSDDPQLWVYLGTALALVLLGGAFAGLTIALMGQDEVYLQVIASSGEGRERHHARRVLNLLQRGKHWVLVTLLLSNVITNETLPIVLDRSLGGGWPAVVSSTILIVIFGEIVPQSICVRYGLPIGAWMTPFVIMLMWLMAPIAWPTAKLLDRLLGEDHGTTYKKAGLKTLVTLHKTLGTSPSERLNQDEVTIISAVLDLKDKPVGSIMTPMSDVFTLSADSVLNEDMMDQILAAGYSRIPVHAPDNTRNFVGMLLVKMLITYDPEDCLPVHDFALATLPETRPETSCLDIVNFFQEGKSHMVLVSDFPGESYGALGVVTLEDVIEELIGEEIIDESDVFIDVHKAIRRMAPAPRTRVPKGAVVAEDIDQIQKSAPSEQAGPDKRFRADSDSLIHVQPDQSGRKATLMMRVGSANGDVHGPTTPATVQGSTKDIKEHLRHLGPSNLAKRPRQTRYTTVKIKPGGGFSIAEATAATVAGNPASESNAGSQRGRHSSDPNIGTGAAAGVALSTTGGKAASDAVQAVHQGYGTMSPLGMDVLGRKSTRDAGASGNIASRSRSRSSSRRKEGRSRTVDGRNEGAEKSASQARKGNDSSSSTSGSTSPVLAQRAARSGSIIQHTLDTGGITKLVLEANESSESDGTTPQVAGQRNTAGSNGRGQERDDDRQQSQNKTDDGTGENTGKKRRKRLRRDKSDTKGSPSGQSGDGGKSDTTPLLKGED